MELLNSKHKPCSGPEAQSFYEKMSFNNFTIKLLIKLFKELSIWVYTVNPNPVQLTAFPCKSIPTGKNLLSLQGNPVLIAGSLF